MTYDRRPPNHDCPPGTNNPAPQPKPPGHAKCEPITPTAPPVLDPPTPCPPDPYCKCPTTPGSDPDCLDKSLADATAAVANVDKQTEYKGELDSLVKLARAASQKYTRTKYEELLKAWDERDKEIAILVSRLVCIVPCWRCVIDCHICPLLEKLRYAERWLYDDEKLVNAVYDLYDLQYWHTRDKQVKDRRLARVRKMLEVWTNVKTPPADAIEQTIKANKELHDSINQTIGTDPGKAIYDVFLKLVPRHLAIAPPVRPGSTKWITRIDKEFTEFCKCDEGQADNCCGPDVGKLSLRERLVGPLPYLIDPNEYFALICCLIDNRLKPARDEAWKAAAELALVTERIAQQVAKLTGEWQKTFETDAKGAIPKTIDCCEYDTRETSRSDAR